MFTYQNASGPKLTLPAMIVTSEKHEIIDLEDEKKGEDTQTSSKTSLAISASPLNDPSRIPPNLLNIPYEVREKILIELLWRPWRVIPCYNCGSVTVPDFMAVEPDIDISLLLVNKQLHAESARVLYGLNHFKFLNPQLALWWFQRIGDLNLSRVSAASFAVDAEEDFGLQVREERLWLALFTFLQPRQELKSIGISFDQWNKEGFHMMKSCDQDRIKGPRAQCLNKLAEYRGLQWVQFLEGEFLSSRDADYLINTMTLPPDTPPLSRTVIEADAIVRQQSRISEDQAMEMENHPNESTEESIFSPEDSGNEAQVDENTAFNDGYHYNHMTGCYYDHNEVVCKGWYEDDSDDNGHRRRDEN